MNGGGAKVCPGGAATGGAVGAAHLVLTMKGGRGGATGSGFCGRPTSAVAQVGTQRSQAAVVPLWASPVDERQRSRHAIAAADFINASRPVSRLREPRAVYREG